MGYTIVALANIIAAIPLSAIAKFEKFRYPI